MAGKLVINHHSFHFIDENIWASCFVLLEQEKSLLSSPLAMPPRSKLSWNVSQVENQPDVFQLFSCIYKQSPKGVKSGPSKGHNPRLIVQCNTIE